MRLEDIAVGHLQESPESSAHGLINQKGEPAFCFFIDGQTMAKHTFYSLKSSLELVYI
jgi:hypothetical protein